MSSASSKTTYLAYCGAETGYLKGVNTVKRNFQNLNKGETLDREHEVTSMIWADPEETKIHCALKNQVVNTYNAESGLLLKSFDASAGKGPIKGLEKLGNDLVTCSQSGAFRLWRDNPVEVEVGSDVFKMRKSPHSDLFATGGKENDLKIWDFTNTEKAVFQAKNVRNDKLDLRVPVWVTDMRFLDESRIVVGTGYNKIRIYDIKGQQRRPVSEMIFDEYPITSLCLVPQQEHTVVVGNTHGKVALFDIRKQRLIHCFKGFAGSVRSVEVHPTKPYVVSCSLDRFLRVHDLNTHVLLSKVYLKSRLTCLLLRSGESDLIKSEEEDDDDVPKAPRVKRSRKLSQMEKDEDYESVDALWNKMGKTSSETCA